MAKANTQATNLNRPDVEPACTIRLQCSDKDFREVEPSKLGDFYDTCDNCFPDGIVGAETVVVGRSMSAKSMHLKHNPEAE